MPNLNRRHILASGLALSGALLSHGLLRRSPQTTVSAQRPKNTPMPERQLGRTGLSVPILGLGGAGQTPLSGRGAAAEAKAIALIETALTLGIRYFDTAASYGPSEDYLGKVLPPQRANILLASKTARRDRDGAWRELERSLTRLKTDHLDFWQLHHVSFAADIEQIFAKTGAIQALEEAKAQKIIRFAGITGHHEPDIIVEGLKRYPFDTALIPVNAADPHHPRPFIPAVLPTAQAKQVGIIAMKVPAYGRLFKPGILNGMSEAMGYALSQAGVHCCIIAAENPNQLTENVQVARSLTPLSADALADIEARTATVWQDNTFFRAWG